MIVRTALLFFPIIPIGTLLLVLSARYLLRRDISLPALVVNNAVQIAVGIYLIAIFYNVEGVHIEPLSGFQYSIVFAFDSTKIYFLAALLIPMLFSFHRLATLNGFTIRVIFLFYLTGCSGLVVIGDLFSFFVLYELMIMAAYMLIAIKEQYYASIKYMLFGAVSSAFFLAGIVLLYASGAYFNFAFVEVVSELSRYNLKLVLMLFSTAFFIKAAFFPVSSWIATCHSATNGLISAFLSSFTVFTGLFGLYYLVIQPAIALGYEPIFTFLRHISLVSIFASALFLFFEPDFKRCIAGSTAYSIAMVGILLSYRELQLAVSYIVVHACYKSLFFLLADDIDRDQLRLTGSAATLVTFAALVLFVGGLFPTLTHFIKSEVPAIGIRYKMVSYVSLFLALAAFLKFRYRVDGRRTAVGLVATAGLLLLLLYGLFTHYPQAIAAQAVIIESALLLAAALLARPLFRRLAAGAAMDARFVFSTLNVELLYVVLLFIAQTALLRFVLE